MIKQVIVVRNDLNMRSKPTFTCLAIGPDKAEKIDKITGHLKLR